MTTAQKNPAMASIVGCLERTLGYGEMAVKDIPAEHFTRMPFPKLSHPAFNIGHLSIYPDRIFGLLGRPELASPKDGWEDLFKAGAVCEDDAKKYPAKDEIVAYYVDRYRALADMLRDEPDETLERENPAEGRMKEMFPTMGLVINFLANNHHMMHLGQISAWRRTVGLGPVF